MTTACTRRGQATRPVRVGGDRTLCAVACGGATTHFVTGDGSCALTQLGKIAWLLFAPTDALCVPGCRGGIADSLAATRFPQLWRNRWN